VKDATVEANVRYGMHVFEHEHAEKERIRENQADEAKLEQAQGGSRKKCRREEERRTMTLGVNSGMTADDEFGFSDEEVAVSKESCTGIHRVQKLQSNRAHNQQRMGSVSCESAVSTISGPTCSCSTCSTC
jgi:hypothetical protein